MDDAAAFHRYYAIRGRVVKVTAEGGAEHIESLSQRYTGGAYAWYGGRDQVRVILKISADKIHDMARRRRRHLASTDGASCYGEAQVPSALAES